MLRSTRTMLSMSGCLVQEKLSRSTTSRITSSHDVVTSNVQDYRYSYCYTRLLTLQPDSHLSAATEHTIGNGPVPHCSCTSNKIRVLAAPTREHRRTKIRLYTRTDERENFCDIFPRRFTHTTQRRKRALLYGEPPVIHTHKSL